MTPPLKKLKRGNSAMTKTKPRTIYISIIITAVISIVLTVAAGHFLGFHLSHSVTVTDEETGEETTLWTCGMHPWILEEEPGLCPICQMNLTPKRNEGAAEVTMSSSDRKIAYWRAPMNPIEIYDEPGKSAMGMDLVPVYEDEVVGGVAVSIDPVTQQNMGIRTAEVKKGPLTRSIRTYGHVTFDETRTAQISPKLSGWVEKIHADYTGKRVKKGEPLFDLYAPELVSAQEEYLSTFQNAGRLSNKHSRKLIATARRRLEYFEVPTHVIKKIETSGRTPKTFSIRSPLDGYITMKKIEKGSYIKAGTSVLKIADLSRVWVEAHIFEYELPWVAEGLVAEMTLPYQPGKTFKGKVSYIYPYLQAKTRDVVVRLDFDNPDFSIKPDMYANVRIQTMGKGEGLMIPSEAIIRSGERNVVFVTRENNKFSPRNVTLGLSLDDRMVQVLSGLAPGETLVTSGQFMLDSESKLKEAVQKMMDAKMAKKESQEAPEPGGADDFFDDMEEDNDDFFSDMK
jgi:multidrug efflux pump subunit AcrA (membrane-fusion protein)